MKDSYTLGVELEKCEDLTKDVRHIQGTKISGYLELCCFSDERTIMTWGQGTSRFYMFISVLI